MAAHILSTTLMLLAASLVLPVAAADQVDTPPVGVPATVVPSCVAQVSSRLQVFCSSGTNAVCVEDTACAGSAPNGACSQVAALIVCVSRRTVGGGDPVVPAQTLDTCIPYNAAALTNACLNSGSQNRTVPAVTLGSQNVCVVGNVCQPVPVPVVGEQVVTGPAPYGYFEATVLCPVNPTVPCRVDF